MNGLKAGEVVELLDAGLDVMLGDTLASGNGSDINLINHGAVGLKGTGRNGQAKFGLRGHDGQPQLALHDDLGFR